MPQSGTSVLKCDKISEQAVKIGYGSDVGCLDKLSGRLAEKSFIYAMAASFEVGARNWTAGLPRSFANGGAMS